MEDEDYLAEAREASVDGEELDVDEEDEDEEDEEDDEDEELDEDYLRLDTIVEEDEDDATTASSLAAGRRDCDKLGRSSHHVVAGAGAGADHVNQIRSAPSSSVSTAAAAASSLSSPLSPLRSGTQELDSLSSELTNESVGSKTNSGVQYKQQNKDKHQQQQQQEQENVNPRIKTATTKQQVSSDNMESKQQIPSRKSQANSDNHLLLPSTNRLISEHQARNQQLALFRALAERQKLMDELGADDEQRVDLMSGVSLRLSSSSSSAVSASRSLTRQTNVGSESTMKNNKRHQQKSNPNAKTKTGSRSAVAPTTTAAAATAATGYDDDESMAKSFKGGVPLSSIDLSSMSDRMLDELLGHIASASSSSLSSNGESLDSSDLSSSSSQESDELNEEEDESDDRANVVPRQGHRSQQAAPDREAQNRHKRRQRDGAATNKGSRAKSRSGKKSSSLSSAAIAGELTGNGATCDIVIDAPNIVGVHEDLSCVSRRQGSVRSSSLQCRDAHRKATSACDSDDRDDEDDDDHLDHELVVHLNGEPASGATDSLSPSAEPSGSSSSHHHHHHQLHHHQLSSSHHHQLGDHSSLYNDLDCTGASSSLVSSATNATSSSSRTSSSVHESPSAQPANKQSVETILRRMLEALNEAGREASEEQLQSQQQASSRLPGGLPTKQEQLNELLERGFSHLEQLLNCSLAPQQQQQQYNTTMSQSDSKQSTGSQLHNNSQMSPKQQQQQPTQQNVAQKLISGQPQSATTTTATMSKDSDYGSDTQSADCFSSHLTNATLTTEQQQQQPANQSQQANILSPVAIELSNRLFESIKKLATQQQQQVAASSASSSPVSGGKRTPMKSVVLINATRSPSAASIVSSSNSSEQQQRLAACASPTSGDNPTPDLAAAAATTPTSPPLSGSPASRRHEPTKQRAQFKTCVSIGASSPVIGSSASASASERQISERQTKIAREDPEAATSTIVVKVQNPMSKQQAEAANQQQQQQQVTSQQQATSQQQQVHQQLERRRSARSSLRRRPSFTGSINGAQHPRPGSPVPRSLLAEVASQAADSAACEAPAPANEMATRERQLHEPAAGKGQQVEAEAEAERRHFKRMQRALVYGQKYNYSPTKLAYSKLGAQLQLPAGHQMDDQKSAAAAAANGQNHANGSRTLNGKSVQQQREVTAQQVQVSGQVELDIAYFAKSGSLTVHLLQCSQLAPVSKRRTTSNPYVKLYLLPDKTKSGKRKSSVKRSDLEPKFDERFTFGPLELHEFEGKILWLSVWHKDRLGRNEFLGELLLPLVQVRQQLLSTEMCQSTGAKWYPLGERFVPQAEESNLAGGRSLANRSATLPTNGARQAHGRKMASQSPAAAAAAATTAAATKRVVDFNEFQLKAARLTSAVGIPPGGLQTHQQQQQQHQQVSNIMNVTQGPVAELNAASRALITGQLFVALKFVPDGRDLSTTAQRAQNIEGELHVLIKEAHNIAGFESTLAGKLIASAAAAAATGDSNALSNHKISSLVEQQVQLPPSGSLPNPYCKCYLLSAQGQRVAKQKTPLLKRTINPRWDHKCVFHSLKLSQLSSQAIEIQLYNRDSILVSHTNELLGGIRLCRASSSSSSSGGGNPASETTGDMSLSSNGSGGATLLRNRSIDNAAGELEIASGQLCTERESRLWNQMLAKPNIWVYGELRLRQLAPLVAIPNAAPQQQQQHQAATQLAYHHQHQAHNYETPKLAT